MAWQGTAEFDPIEIGSYPEIFILSISQFRRLFKEDGVDLPSSRYWEPLLDRHRQETR